MSLPKSAQEGQKLIMSLNRSDAVVMNATIQIVACGVNTHRSVTRGNNALHIVAPMVSSFSKESQSQRLRQARIEAGFGRAVDFCRRYGIEPGTYGHHENGKRGLEPDVAGRYASYLKVSPWWLLSGQETAEKTERIESMNITHYVGKNGELFQMLEKNWRPISFPGNLPVKIEAAFVRSNDMYPVFREGQVIFYTRQPIIHIPHAPAQEEAHAQVNYNQPSSKDPYAEFYGKPCLVELSDGRILLRELKRGSERGRYILGSYNAPDSEDVEIRAAYKIVFIKTDFADNF